MSSSSSISIITQELLLATALVGGISFLADLFYFLFYLVEDLGIGCQGRIQGCCFCESSLEKVIMKSWAPATGLEVYLMLTNELFIIFSSYLMKEGIYVFAPLLSRTPHLRLRILFKMETFLFLLVFIIDSS